MHADEDADSSELQPIKERRLKWYAKIRVDAFCLAPVPLPSLTLRSYSVRLTTSIASNNVVDTILTPSRSLVSKLPVLNSSKTIYRNPKKHKIGRQWSRCGRILLTFVFSVVTCTRSTGTLIAASRRWNDHQLSSKAAIQCRRSRSHPSSNSATSWR
jgi:hypothetical protein